MCFSAQASFMAALGLGIMGVFTLKKIKDKRSIFFAITPFLFALQQGAEGFVWISLQSSERYPYFIKTATGIFLFFAGIVWPLWIPMVLYILEKKSARKKLLLGALAAGGASALIALTIGCYMGIEPHILNHHISYLFVHNRLSESILNMVNRGGLFLYAIATIGSFFISSVPTMWLLGVLVGSGFIVAHFCYYVSFGSVWCFFAALTSCMIYYIIGQYNKQIQ